MAPLTAKEAPSCYISPLVSKPAPASGVPSTLRSIMIALGWVMLKFIPLSPLYPISVTAIFVVLSGVFYVHSGLRQLNEHEHAQSQ